MGENPQEFVGVVCLNVREEQKEKEKAKEDIKTLAEKVKDRETLSAFADEVYIKRFPIPTNFTEFIDNGNIFVNILDGERLAYAMAAEKRVYYRYSYTE